MKRIKTFIIHALGGVTVEESKRSNANSYDIGCFCTLSSLKLKADTNYGASADDWCHCMYNTIIERLSFYERKTARPQS